MCIRDSTSPAGKYTPYDVYAWALEQSKEQSGGSVSIKTDYYHYWRIDQLVDLGLEMTDKNGVDYWGVVPPPDPGKLLYAAMDAQYTDGYPVNWYKHSCYSAGQDWVTFGIMDNVFNNQTINAPDSDSYYAFATAGNYESAGLATQMMWYPYDAWVDQPDIKIGDQIQYQTHQHGDRIFRDAVLRTLDWHHPDSEFWMT